ncbi:hypothetical protein [Actinophytocola oryzae]|uniref:SUKH superfamily protein n=1 Tax=Actinophytocola oryzae TaxID=502181 RepID=A0A4R7UTT6_9PSEU|nr:hypothetical protein [Actinophytocola oryzae]TDV35942.1 hypothetical protein CLV71_13338 [Actinophytocola oryzae]
MSDTRDAVDRAAVAVGWHGSVTPRLAWGTVERRLGTPLPGDYKEFMSRFPSGMFRDVIRLFNPVQGKEFLAEFREDFDRLLIGVEILWEEYGTYPPFPRPGGLIPFASDSSGGSLMWLPWTPDVDRWHVVHLSRNVVRGYNRTRRSMTSVMRELATSRSSRNILEWDLADTGRTFEPFT